MVPLSHLRHFRPADRTSAACRLSPVRLFPRPHGMGVACGSHALFCVQFFNFICEVYMNKLLPKLATMAAVGYVLCSNPMPAQVSPTTQKAARVRITQGPELELAKEHLTIIRWTTNNPGGSPEHYGIVRCGTDPKNLSQTASSPIRLNPDHGSTIFRVRLDDLKPGTTYYYRVGSMEANDTDDGTKSTIKQFTTPGESQRAGR